MSDNGLRCVVRRVGFHMADTTVVLPGGEVGICLHHDLMLERATERGDAGAFLSAYVSTSDVVKSAEEVAIQRLQGHVDAEHWGTVDGGCERCVDLAAGAGIDLTRGANRSTDGGE